ncbi:MAG: class I SAM-dependent methyltransferase [Flavitalea sp.]
MGKELVKAGSAYSAFQLVLKYARYWFGASSGKGHGIHSPFVFDFIQHALNDRHHYQEYAQVEALRKKLLRNQSRLAMEDMGAGSAAPAGERTVAAIAASAAKSPKLAQLLFRVVHYYQPSSILELGTSLGISACYLSLGNPRAAVVTGEGNRHIAAVARKNFSSLGIEGIHITEGNFNETLDRMIALAPGPELIFIDGNHRKEPTLKYFSRLLQVVPASSVMIFDDIHWSAEMESAWEAIKDDPSVMLTVDLFFMGFIFFRPEFKVKQHFTIRY